VSPQVSCYFRSVSAYAEYARSRQGVSRQTTHADITNTAWQVVGAVLLTGETAGERIRPRQAFDPEQRKWGALQLTARYGELSVDPTAFTLGFADANASRQAQVATVGAVWFLTTNLKAMANVERSVFDRNPDGPRHAEHAILVRLQLNY
jgi:phosphate-selective porin OprO/OprP